MKMNEGFSQLPLKKKLEHIWEYYRVPILAVLFVLLVLVPITVRDLTAPKPILDAILLNSDAQESTANGFEEFFAEYGYEYYEGAVSVNTNYGFFDADELALLDDPMMAEQENREKETLLSALLAGGGTELFFGTGDMFLNYAGQGLLADLSAILPPELLEQYADRLVYTNDGGTVESYPCAVGLSDNPWLAENGYYSGQCYFGIMYLADNPEMAADFAEFLLKQ